MSLEVSTTPSKVRRTLAEESSMVMDSDPSSTSLTISATALRGMITPGMPSEPLGAGIFTRGEPLAVGGHRAHHGGPARLEGVEIDAVEIIARLLGGDRELRLLDEALEVGGRKGEAMGQVAGGE